MLVSPEIPYITVFGFNIFYYGIILALAIFVGIVISNRVAIREYFLYGLVPNIATSVIIGGIIGARLYYCLLNSSMYISNPIEIFALREGGMSIHGAILGGVIVLLYQAKKHNVELLKLCDIFAMGMPVAQAIGRWGNFFNSEAFGLPTTMPWGLYIRPQYRPERFFNSEYFHPTFLYESILDILLFIILYKFVFNKYKDNSGCITAIYLILYSVIRILVEQIRVDCVKYVYGVPFPLVVSVILIIFASCFLVLKNIKD